MKKYCVFADKKPNTCGECIFSEPVADYKLRVKYWFCVIKRNNRYGLAEEIDLNTRPDDCPLIEIDFDNENVRRIESGNMPEPPKEDE